MMRSCSASAASRSSSAPRLRYRTRAPTSQVDEGLFGGAAPSKGRGRSVQRQQGETVQIITKDLIRTLRIPSKDPAGQLLVLPAADLQQRPQLLTQEEREALREQHLRRREEDLKAAEEWKRRLVEADLSRKEQPVLSELELEAQERARRLLERADALRMEQDDHVVRLNKLILSAQCQATRDDQIQQKKQIQTELWDEEKRLDAMMEAERRQVLEATKQIEELRKQQRISGRQQIQDQIQERLEEKQLQEEMKEQEGQQIREAQEKMNQEDLETLERKWEEQQRLQEEVMRINAETIRAKEQRQEEEKLAEIRAVEYVKTKMAREAEYEAEQRRVKKEKELEIARLRAQQERAKDYKADQDELRAWRNQEKVDREWRRKEKELAGRRAQQEAMLRAARLEQVQCKEHLLSMEAGREKAEFERVLRAQQEAIAKQKQEEAERRLRALRHSEAIRQQVKERQVSAAARHRDYFKEAERLSEEARQRRRRLDEYKEKKLQELRATGLSEQYCSEVERKAGAGQL